MIGHTNAVLGFNDGFKPFSYYATHLDELGAVLQMHYDGVIDLSTIWSVGDVMTDIPLSAISASSLGGDSQSAQNVDFVILDFNHDTLTSDTSKKAAITVAQLDCLSTLGKFYSSYNSYTYARYTGSDRRTWLNSDYYNALPSDLKSLIKPVNKITCYPTNSSNSQTTETTSETCWFAGPYEIFGTYYDTVQDGTQYPYYQTQSNRIKKQGKTGSAYFWWGRSGYWDSSVSVAYFSGCSSYGGQTSDAPWDTRGIAPHFCL